MELPFSLEAIFPNQNLHHAYLFIGERREAKKVALELIKRLDISLPDQIVLKEDIPLTISEVRRLIKSVYLKPHSSLYKVVLIEKAENLAEEASNALLKTLEEPPAHSIFILIAREASKILETVASRCQKIKITKRENGPAELIPAKPLDEIAKLTIPQKFLLAQELALSSNLEAIFQFWLNSLSKDLRQNKVDVKLVSKVKDYASMSQFNVGKRLLLENLFLEL